MNHDRYSWNNWFIMLLVYTKNDNVINQTYICFHLLASVLWTFLLLLLCFRFETWYQITCWWNIVTSVTQSSLWPFKSYPPSDAYMRRWAGSSWLLLKACRLFGAKSLPEPMLAYCQWEHISVKFESEGHQQAQCWRMVRMLYMFYSKCHSFGFNNWSRD